MRTWKWAWLIGVLLLIGACDALWDDGEDREGRGNPLRPAPEDTTDQDDDPAIMWIARIQDRAGVRTYMRLDAPGGVPMNADSSVTDPVFRTSGASISYQISGCDSVGIPVGFTYIAPVYYGESFTLICGRHLLTGRLACADLSFNGSCQVVVEFHLTDIRWDGTPLPVNDDSRNQEFKFGPWRLVFGEVSGVGRDLTLTAIHVIGPDDQLEAWLSHIERTSDAPVPQGTALRPSQW